MKEKFEVAINELIETHGGTTEKFSMRTATQELEIKVIGHELYIEYNNPRIGVFEMTGARNNWTDPPTWDIDFASEHVMELVIKAIESWKLFDEKGKVLLEITESM
jgi:hypothetical protein